MNYWDYIRTLVLIVGCSVVSVFGGGIRWGNDFGTTAVDSGGEALDSSWTFHMGYFESGFTPNSSNSTEWSNRWTTLDVSAYSASSQLFGNLWDNDGVSTGRKGYIWGFNRSLDSNEWILFSAASWVIPFNNPLNPDENWFTADAEVVVVGSIVGLQLQTAIVTGEPPSLSGKNWLQLHFDESERSDPMVSGWGSDPDLDGSTNLEEFAFGSDPSENDQICIEGEIVLGYLQFRCERARGVEVLFFGQVSSNLSGWNEGAAFVQLENETPDTLIYRDLTPVSSENARFGRVRVSLLP